MQNGRVNKFGWLQVPTTMADGRSLEQGEDFWWAIVAGRVDRTLAAWRISVFGADVGTG
jgi:hypothetical protein